MVFVVIVVERYDGLLWDRCRMVRWSPSQAWENGMMVFLVDVVQLYDGLRCDRDRMA